MKLKTRLRRTRQNPAMRRLFKETSLSAGSFVMPYFVREGRGMQKSISSMPGIFQFSRDLLIKQVKEDRSLGIPAVILFGIPEKKNEECSEAFNPDGVIQNAVRSIKEKVPDILVITDVCLCEYSDHGHCGIIKKGKHGFDVDNDETLELLSKTAVSHAEAGADIVAPSAMMDGMVAAIRQGLDCSGFTGVPIMAYSAKYASAFYAPFRTAAESPPKFGDRSTYQMDISNSAEALREVELDIKEGADIVMVKPALPYLDIISKVRAQFNVPVAAYNVSGEYSMLKAAEKAGFLQNDKAVIEVLTSIKRAGADIIISYHSKEAAKLLNGQIKKTF